MTYSYNETVVLPPGVAMFVEFVDLKYLLTQIYSGSRSQVLIYKRLPFYHLKEALLESKRHGD